MDKYERTALKFANKIRKLTGQPPIEQLPTGRVQSARSCPIAMALSNGVRFSILHDTAEFRYERIDGEISLPADVASFIERFDDKQYPHLIRRGKQ